jgi:TatD DNase family protein
MIELIDTHSHLDYSEFDADRDEVVKRAAEQGVTRIITIGTNLEGSRRALKLAEKYEGVYASVGVHPNDCDEAPEDAIDRLRELAKHRKVVAIGETGLDYHYLPSRGAAHLREIASPRTTMVGALETRPRPPNAAELAADAAHKSRQAQFFRAQLELAFDVGKPVIIHQRDSFDDVAEILEGFIGKGDGRRLRGVFHCFGENLMRAQRVLALGFHLSFTGILTFKNAVRLREVAAALPLDRLMVETDCPFLAPQPHRGKRCEPAYVRLVAEQLAAVQRRPLEEVAGLTTETARRLFGV